MRSALEKIRIDSRTLTVHEKKAVQHALDDLGELYLYSRSPYCVTYGEEHSTGFSLSTSEEAKESRQMGRNAFDQARLFGVITRSS